MRSQHLNQNGNPKVEQDKRLDFFFIFFYFLECLHVSGLMLSKLTEKIEKKN